MDVAIVTSHVGLWTTGTTVLQERRLVNRDEDSLLQLIPALTVCML